MERERELDESSSQAPSEATSENEVSSRKRKVSGDDEGDDAKLTMVDALGSIIAAMDKGNAIYEKTCPWRSRAGEIFQELVAIGVEKDLLMSSASYLVGNTTRMNAFFGVPSERRKELLEHMLYLLNGEERRRSRPIFEFAEADGLQRWIDSGGLDVRDQTRGSHV